MLAFGAVSCAYSSPTIKHFIFTADVDCDFDITAGYITFTFKKDMNIKIDCLYSSRGSVTKTSYGIYLNGTKLFAAETDYELHVSENDVIKLNLGKISASIGSIACVIRDPYSQLYGSR